jgi:pimeloyl-ACP methyl ester carboxylesterase
VNRVPDLILLPGLGANDRLFQYQAVSLPGSLVSPAWPSHREGESLAGFARRLAATLPDHRPRFVGGASFGGMVALELAALVRPEAVILIGSCTTSKAVSPWLRVLGRLCSRLPESFFRGRPWTSPVLLPIFGLPGAAERKLFWEMAAAVDPAFLRWGCRAILSWRPTAYDGPVFHLHGSADRIIPVHRVRPSQVVKGAGHLLSLSHPVETTDFLSRILGEVRGLSQTKS